MSLSQVKISSRCLSNISYKNKYIPSIARRNPPLVLLKRKYSLIERSDTHSLFKMQYPCVRSCNFNYTILLLSIAYPSREAPPIQRVSVRSPLTKHALTLRWLISKWTWTGVKASKFKVNCYPVKLNGNPTHSPLFPMPTYYNHKLLLLAEYWFFI